MIDNFDIIKKHITFDSPFDRYVIHVLKRAKDNDGKTYGVNEGNRLIKSFYVGSLDYYERKQEVIKELCHINKARAYILPQVRDNSECLKELLILTVNNLSNPTIKPDHLIRSAFCGYHGSRAKKWILDLDSDNMVEYFASSPKGDNFIKKIWTPEEVLGLVKSCLMEINHDPNDAFIIPTKNGHSIVTSPFNLMNGYKQCNMLFQGNSKRFVRREYTGPGEYTDITKTICGWLIKDGSALLYME